MNETTSTAPASSVFFDSAPTAGRASRFRQLFAQEPPRQPAPLAQEPRPNIERTYSNPVYDNPHNPSASVEDREGFQRIMAMLGGGGEGGGGGKPNLARVHPMPQLFLIFSLWTNLLHTCNRCHHIQCRMVQDQVNPRMNSSRDFFDRVSLWPRILLHSRVLHCKVPQCL